jgi:hypothetical protein
MATKHWHWALFALVLSVCAVPQPVRADTQQYVVVYMWSFGQILDHKESGFSTD